MVSTIEKLNLEAIEQSPVLRIAGASLTVGGLVGAGVILIGAFCVSWLITRACGACANGPNAAVRPCICWSGCPAMR